MDGIDYGRRPIVVRMDGRTEDEAKTVILSYERIMVADITGQVTVRESIYLVREL